MQTPLSKTSMRHGARLALIVLGIGLMLLPGWAAAPAVTVTVMQKEPMETLSPGGEVMGVSRATVGATYTFVSSEGQQVILKDAQGNHFRIAASATDYIPPASTPQAVPPIATVTATSHTTPAAPSTPATAAASPAPSASTPGAPTDSTVPLTEDGVTKINTALGKPFFATQPLWNETALLVANRLGLHLEDKTKWETAYRRYFYDRIGKYAPASILGGDAYCVALYADANDKPTSLLIAFINDGDYRSVSALRAEIYELQNPSGAEQPNAARVISALQSQIISIHKSFEPNRKAEQGTLTKNLTVLFGGPQTVSFGANTDMRENSLRWDWNGVSFLLTCKENKYNLLRIIPTELADNHGRTQRIPLDEMVEKLRSAVEHRPNGDVVISQLPMADQGLKGYCVPATWERVLRYTGVPGDMYTLSRIGGAGFGGGERGSEVATQLNDTLFDYGRKAQFLTLTKFDIYSLHSYLDQGIPIFWGVNPSGYASVEQRYALCDREKDWDDWKKLLDQSRSPDNPKPPALEDIQGHQVLITGYNSQTNEIAWSDPWGRNTQERWMTLEEAQRCSLGEFYIITW